MSNFDFIESAEFNFPKIRYYGTEYSINISEEGQVKLLQGLTDAEEMLMIDEKASVNKMRTVLQDKSIIGWPKFDDKHWALRDILKDGKIKNKLCDKLNANKSMFGWMDFSEPEQHEYRFYKQIKVASEYMLYDLIVAIMNFGSHGQLNTEQEDFGDSNQAEIKRLTDDYVNQNFYNNDLAALLFFVVHYVFQMCADLNVISTFDFSKISVGGFSLIYSGKKTRTYYAGDTQKNLGYTDVGVYTRKYDVGREEELTSYVIIKHFFNENYIDKANYDLADDEYKIGFNLFRNRLECFSFEFDHPSPALLYASNSRHNFLVYRFPKGAENIRQLNNVKTQENDIIDYIKMVTKYFLEIDKGHSLIRELISEDVWVYDLNGEEKIFYSGFEWFDYDTADGERKKYTVSKQAGKSLTKGKTALTDLITSIGKCIELSKEDAETLIDDLLKTNSGRKPKGGDLNKTSVESTYNKFINPSDKTADDDSNSEVHNKSAESSASVKPENGSDGEADDPTPKKRIRLLSWLFRRK